MGKTKWKVVSIFGVCTILPVIVLLSIWGTFRCCLHFAAAPYISKLEEDSYEGISILASECIEDDACIFTASEASDLADALCEFMYNTSIATAVVTVSEWDTTQTKEQVAEDWLGENVSVDDAMHVLRGRGRRGMGCS